MSKNKIVPNYTARDFENGPPSRRTKRTKTMLGWKEWALLPNIGQEPIHVKIDTGARTSALHVEVMRIVETENGERVEFGFKKPRKTDFLEDSFFPFKMIVAGRKRVKSSSGHLEQRIFINMPLTIAGMTQNVDITLTDRTKMEFPMLIGRSALRKHFTINPARAYLGGRVEKLPSH